MLFMIRESGYGGFSLKIAKFSLSFIDRRIGRYVTKVKNLSNKAQITHCRDQIDIQRCAAPPSVKLGHAIAFLFKHV